MKNFYSKIIKRALDVVFAALLLVLLLPVFAILAILVAVKLGTPIMFSQERAGKDGKIFTLYKFRSMTEKKDEAGVLLPDAQRLTHFGETLRRTSLDELPELVNILRGEMSFVGPRPLPARYLPRYSKQQAHRHDVLPGLTGLAQINGRNAISWEQKFGFDVSYTENISFLLDTKIFFGTIKAIFSASGISAEGDATMPEFMGSVVK